MISGKVAELSLDKTLVFVMEGYILKSLHWAFFYLVFFMISGFA